MIVKLLPITLRLLGGTPFDSVRGRAVQTISQHTTATETLVVPEQ